MKPQLLLLSALIVALAACGTLSTPTQLLPQCSWFQLLENIALQVGVHDFQHVDEKRAEEVLTDAELVGLDGMEPVPNYIHLPALGLHEQLLFCRVQRKLRLQGLQNPFHVSDSRVV